MIRARRESLIRATFLGIAAVCLSVTGQAAAQTFPTDEAALYEAAKKEGSLVWYESAPLEPMRAIATEFQKKYPGIKVEVLRVVGVQQYQRFMQETEAKQNIADILQLSDQPSMVALSDEGHLASWKVPTHDRYADIYRIKDHAYANYVTDIAIVYNVNKVTPEEVKLLQGDWKAILDPRFKGRFASTTMQCGTCYAPVNLFMDPKYKDKFGPEFLRQIAAQKPALYSEVLVGLDRVIAGEHDFTFWTWESIALTKYKEGAPIRWVHPRPTPIFANTWQGISKYAPHPNAARLFQTWSMSEEGEKLIQSAYGAITTMKDLPDSRPITKEPWYDPIVEPYPIDFKRWDKEYSRDMEMWIKILQASK